MLKALEKVLFLFIVAAVAAVAAHMAVTVTDSYAQSADALKPPVIIQPEDMDEIRGEYLVTVIWKKVPGAARYHMVVAKDRRFSEIVYENADIRDTSHKVDNLDFGTYFIKMRSISTAGTAGEFGHWTGFIIVPPSPERLRARP